MAQRFASPLTTRGGPLSLNYTTYDAAIAAGQLAASENPFASILKSIDLVQAKNDGSEELSLDNQQDQIDNAQLTGTLTPNDGETQSSLNLILDWKRDELARKSVLANAPDDIVTSVATLGTGLFVSMLDPLNVASAFVPVVSTARYSAMLAQRASTVGRFAVRSRVGSAEGFVGAALVEPIVYSAAQYRQADYNIYDTFANLAFGTVLGGGLHGVGGMLIDNIRPPKTAQNVIQGIDSATAEARQSAFRAGVGQLAAGRQVFGIDYILRADLENSTAVGRVYEPKLADDQIDEAIEAAKLVLGQNAKPHFFLRSLTGAKNIGVARKEVERLEKLGFEVQSRPVENGTFDVDLTVPTDLIAQSPDGRLLTFPNKKIANKARTRLKKEEIIEDGTAVKIGDEWFIVQNKDKTFLDILAKESQNIVLPTEFPSINITRAVSEQTGGERIIPDVDYGTDQILKANNPEALIFSNQEIAYRKNVEENSEQLFDDLDEARANDEISQSLEEVEQLKIELNNDELLDEAIIVSEKEVNMAATNAEQMTEINNGYKQAAACVLQGF